MIRRGWGRAIRSFVNDHFAGHGPASVRMLQERLGLPAVAPQSIGDQPSLF